MIQRALTQEDRVAIIRPNAQGRSLRQIGAQIGRSHATVQTYCCSKLPKQSKSHCNGLAPDES